MGVTTVREEQAMRQLTSRLVERFTDTHSAEQVENAVHAARSRFEGHPVRAFVPILVERIVRRELGHTTNTESDTAPAVVANTARSHMRFDFERAVAALRRSLSSGKSRIVLPAAAVIIAVVVVVVVAVHKPDSVPTAAPTTRPLTVVHGVVGSEKLGYFQDPKVIGILARHGLEIHVDPAGSRQIATSIDLGHYDFAFPSSAPAAERIQRQRGVRAKYTPFSSPLAIATFKPIADLLTNAGIVRQQGPTPIFDVARYLELVGNDIRWDQLENNTVFPARKNLLVSTTDPRSSNSAAMYLAIASYVANGNTIVQGAAAERAVLPTLSRLFLSQGYTENTTEGPLEEYLALGMGETPLALIYEAQYLDAAAHGRIKPDMVLTYPSPTVLSRHTLIPLHSTGDRIGRLLSTDPDLQRLAAEHGFRSNDTAQFTKVVADLHTPVAATLVDTVDPPAYDTLEHLLDGVARSYN